MTEKPKSVMLIYRNDLYEDKILEIVYDYYKSANQWVRIKDVGTDRTEMNADDLREFITIFCKGNVNAIALLGIVLKGLSKEDKTSLPPIFDAKWEENRKKRLGFYSYRD